MLLKIALLSTISTDLKLERVRHARDAVRAQKAMTVLSLESWVVELIAHAVWFGCMVWVHAII